jgi:hypothetical protein
VFSRDGTAGVFDHRGRNVLEDLLGAFAPERNIAAARLAEPIRRIVGSIARHGSAVVVAREASCLVDPHHALRVRLVASLGTRINELATRLHVSAGAAQRMVASSEKERAAFIRRTLGYSLADPAHYDVVVNTGTYAQERAEAVVLMAYLAKFGEWPPTALVLRGKRPLRAEQVL